MIRVRTSSCTSCCNDGTSMLSYYICSLSLLRDQSSVIQDSIIYCDNLTLLVNYIIVISTSRAFTVVTDHPTIWTELEIYFNCLEYFFESYLSIELYQERFYVLLIHKMLFMNSYLPSQACPQRLGSFLLKLFKLLKIIAGFRSISCNAYLLIVINEQHDGTMNFSLWFGQGFYENLTTFHSSSSVRFLAQTTSITSWKPWKFLPCQAWYKVLAS